jgi:hypothetical protein
MTSALSTKSIKYSLLIRVIYRFHIHLVGFIIAVLLCATVKSHVVIQFQNWCHPVYFPKHWW